MAPVDLFLEGPGRNVLRLRDLHRECRQVSRPSQLELLLGERGATGHVAEQREREIGVIAQHVGGGGEEIVARARADAAADAFDRRGDLVGVARRRPLGEQLGDERRDAFFAGRIEGAPGTKAQAE